MKQKFFVLSILLLSIFSNTILAQGCSDAGFCTISGVKPTFYFPWQEAQNQVKIGAFYGRADHAIGVWGNYIQYTRSFNSKWSADAKITSLGQSGNGISTFGLGDVFLSGNYKLNDKIHFTFGTKIPLSNASKSKNGIPLPMDYQSSLGTFDLFASVGYKIENFLFNAGVQIPLTQNKNGFYSENIFPDFQPTLHFKRSADVLLRISYPFEISEKFRLTPSVLPIYHLADDKAVSEKIINVVSGEFTNVSLPIKGSKGLTLNANLYADYQFDRHNSLQFNVGLPLVNRKVRPDGLTRSFIATIEYAISF